MARSYSDQSYGGEKTLYSQLWSLGTRPAITIVETLASPMNPIEVVDWNVVNTVAETGATSLWFLIATSSLGTHAIATISLTGTLGAIGAANSVVEGSVTTTGTTHLVGAGGKLYLYSGLSTAHPDPIVSFRVQYKDHYVESDT